MNEGFPEPSTIRPPRMIKSRSCADAIAASCNNKSPNFIEDMLANSQRKRHGERGNRAERFRFFRLFSGPRCKHMRYNRTRPKLKLLICVGALAALGFAAD